MEREYRVSRPRLLAGNSRGGLFVVYSLLAEPSLFDARFALSPALFRDGDAIVTRLDRFLGSSPSLAGRHQGANAAVAIDGFAAPTGWLPPVPVEATAKPSVADKTPAPTLTGVFPRAEGGAAQAIINKKRVKEGEVVDGWRVVKIRGTSSGEKPGVLVARGDRTVELAIEPVLANARTTVTPRAERVQSAAASEGNGR